ncbi:hypothetical protein ACWF94_01245 [Streptomyces sp. NPDC055078]
MKLRHARAIAVFGIALIALTGARGSSGGGCGGSSSSSSSGGSSGSNDNDSDSTTSGGSTGSVTGGSTANRAERDIRIDKCGLDATRKKLTATITVTNTGSLTYDYDITLDFRGTPGDTSVLTEKATLNDVTVGPSGSVTKELSTPYNGTGDGSEYKKCQVASANRTSA